MHDRRHFLAISLAMLVAPTARAASAPPGAPADKLDGAFDHVAGRPGLVIGVPHGTADSGTLDTGKVICKRLNAGGVFVTGFWDPKTRQRVNVNRPTEEFIGEGSKVLRQWQSVRAVEANKRYYALVSETAQGPLRAFYELHSNHRAEYANSIEVSTLGVNASEAKRFKDAFVASIERLAPDVPRLAVHVSPLDRVTYPNYVNASTISRLSQKGCAIEHPGRVFDRRPWRVAYANCLADAIEAAAWG